ncbi:MAG: hypothetical protein II855_00575 [Candidatus Methanomethylophilaceae archaeon]|nr:hypothetical protein [Candidatus Methanomethylophilaceae archaeon]
MASKFGVYKEMFAFSEAVKLRYRTDLIMKVPLTVMIVLMPLIVYLAIMSISNMGGQYDIINDFDNAVVIVMMMIQYLVIALVLYKLYARLQDHSRRDSRWRSSLIGYMRERDAPVEELEALHKKIQWRERFPARVPVLIVMGILYFITAFFFIIYIPDMEATDYTSVNKITAWVTENIIDRTIQFGSGGSLETRVFSAVQQIELALILVLFLMVFTHIVRFPENHEANQAEFTRLMAESLQSLGMTVPPMEQFTPRIGLLLPGEGSPKALRIAAIPFSALLYPFYSILLSAGDMNDHLKNQWSYESELLKYISTDSEEGFREGGYSDMVAEMRAKGNPGDRNWIGRSVKDSILKENRMPLMLIVAEIFLLFLCANYCLKILSLEFEMISDYAKYMITVKGAVNMTLSAWITIVLVIVDIYLMIIATDALLGIASRRPTSWRKVARSCITFMAPLWVSAYLAHFSGFSHLFDFNPFIITGFLYNILLMMLLSVSIKAYYTPIDKETPGILSWLRYIFFGDL